MTVLVAIAAGIGCSLCNGISTVQQKEGADDIHAVRFFDWSLLLRLLKNWPYLFGTFLAIVGYGLSLISLRVLPLFLVQSLIAASVLVTAFGERIFLHKRIGMNTYWALLVVLIGLVLLSTGAVPGPATIHNQTARLLVEVAPVPLTMFGMLLIYAKTRNKVATFTMSALSGLLFGNTSTIGRILVYPTPIWKVLENPIFYSLVFSAIAGQYLFIVSLQRTLATKSNAVMISTQTLGPALCGLLFFDDKIQSGYQLIVLSGGILVLIGAIAAAMTASRQSAARKAPI